MGRLMLFISSLLLCCFSCSVNLERTARDIIDHVKDEYAPDARTAIFNIEISGSNPAILTGETNLPEAKSDLLQQLKSVDITVKDEIVMLPGEQLGKKRYGIVSISVASLRAQPTHSAELVTQALLGTPLAVFKKSNGWVLVQTPDKYIAWANQGSMVPIDSSQLALWKKTERVIYLTTAGFALDTSGQGRVSDLVAGNILMLDDEDETYWHVTYPDGRKALVHKNEARKLNEWEQQLSISDSSILTTAFNLIGIPYLWGGTSTKALDCSGFTKSVYFAHGMIIPRDASQQVNVGELVDAEKDFSKLKVGDLLFFGRKNEDQTEKIVHVGLWIGSDKFIHASTDVHISSMDSLDEDFDQYNYDRYLRTKRIIGPNTKDYQHISGIY